MHWPYRVSVTLNSNFAFLKKKNKQTKTKQKKNLKLFSVGVKELFEPIILQKKILFLFVCFVLFL